jgi:hypothetical protein
MTRSPALASLLVLTLSCSTTATIQRVDGPDNEATIEHSDAHALYVRGSNGQLYRLPRSSVGDIDHPGNVNLILGAALGVMTAAIIISTRNEGENEARAALGVIYGAPSLGLILSGGYSYLRSKEAARKFEEAETSIAPAPPTQAVPDSWLTPPPGKAAPLPPPPPLPPPLPVSPPPAQPPADGGAGRD